MEIKGVNIKSMKYDAFNDNEYIEQLRAGGVNVVVGAAFCRHGIASGNER